MRNRILFTAALLVLSAGLMGVSVYGQSTTQPTPATKEPANPKNQNKKDSGDKDQSIPDAPSATGESTPSMPPPATPTDSGQSAVPKKPSTAEDNPFPEDISKAAAKAASASDATAPSMPPSDTTATPGSPDQGDLDKGASADPSRMAPKLEAPGESVDVYDPKRASEDVRVGRFYLKTGDYKGAYQRFKDATTFNQEDAEAVFWLAEAARRLNLQPEAAQNYALYLAAVPDGPNSKVARKALAELGSAAKR